ncbi:hypothetical protein Dimus_025450 [Dionaea muscipula]
MGRRNLNQEGTKWCSGIEDSDVFFVVLPEDLIRAPTTQMAGGRKQERKGGDRSLGCAEETEKMLVEDALHRQGSHEMSTAEINCSSTLSNVFHAQESLFNLPIDQISRTPSSGDNLAVANLNACGWRQQQIPRPGCVVDGLKMGISDSLDLIGVDGLKMSIGRHPWSARVQQRWRLRSRVGMVGLQRG